MAKIGQKWPKNCLKNVKKTHTAFKNVTSPPDNTLVWAGDAWETVSERGGTPATIIVIFKRVYPFSSILVHFWLF